LKFGGPAAKLLEQLGDLGDKRIAEMDVAYIDMQVLSLTSPGVEQLDAAEAALARWTNDYLADALRTHPTRFSGFATLPTARPQSRCRRTGANDSDYGFKDALINGHVQGRHLDDKFFRPIFERAESLNVPIYLHPTKPVKRVKSRRHTVGLRR
jgi:hypothetical protein